MATDVRPASLRISWHDDGELVLNLDLLQGHWTVEQYLLLTNQTNRLLEYSDGTIEVLPMPTKTHQAISRLLFLALFAFLQRNGGTVFYAPLRLMVRPGKFREPDLLVLRDQHDPRGQDAYWLGADLVVEIVSPDDPQRDTVDKTQDYAAAGIPEYWIVNPIEQTITVLTLDGSAYVAHGVFRRGDHAASKLLDGFSLAVSDILDAH